MATDFLTATAIRDSISTALSRIASGGSERLERFAKRRDALTVMSRLGQFRMMTEEDRQKLRNSVETQSHVIQGLYKKFAPSAKTGRARSGTGAPEIYNVTPNFQTRVREEFDDSFVQHLQRELSPQDFLAAIQEKGSRAQVALANHYAEMLMQTIMNIYERHEAQVIAYLDANNWALTATADAGAFYTTVTGDVKAIPTADAPRNSTTTYPVFLRNLNVEASQNNLAQFGIPLIIGSSSMPTFLNEYQLRGEGNQVNVQAALNFFEFIFTNKLADDTGIDASNADDASFFMIPQDSLEIFNRSAFPYHQKGPTQGGMTVIGNDFYMPPIEVGAGTDIMPEMPPLTLEHKAKMDTTDTSATYGDEGTIDIVESHVFTSQIGIQHAIGEDANVTPILKHRIQSI